MSETPIEQAVTAVEAEAVPAAEAAASALQADVTAKMDELRQALPGLVEELVAKAHEIGGALLSRFHEVVATVEQHLGMAQPPAPVESAPVATVSVDPTNPEPSTPTSSSGSPSSEDPSTTSGSGPSPDVSSTPPTPATETA